VPRSGLTKKPAKINIKKQKYQIQKWGGEIPWGTQEKRRTPYQVLVSELKKLGEGREVEFRERSKDMWGFIQVRDHDKGDSGMSSEEKTKKGKRGRGPSWGKQTLSLRKMKKFFGHSQPQRGKRPNFEDRVGGERQKKKHLNL